MLIECRIPLFVLAIEKPLRKTLVFFGRQALDGVLNFLKPAHTRSVALGAVTMALNAYSESQVEKAGKATVTGKRGLSRRPVSNHATGRPTVV